MDPAPSSRSPDSHSPDSYEAMAAPALRMGWLLRTCAIVSVVASLVGVLVVPGIHGTFSEAVVVRLDRVSLILSYAMGVLLILASVLGAWDLGRASAIPIAARIGAISSGIIVIGLFLPACATRLPPVASALLVLASSMVSLLGALVGSRAPHTRAAALALGFFGFAALLRLVAWHLANYAAVRASMGTWDFARGVATIGLVLEAGGQMVGAAWLGARARIKGQLSSFIALATAFFIVWARARGGSEGAASWQAMLHLSLSDAGGNPRVFGGLGIPTFLSVAALTLAGAVCAQWSLPAAVTTALALALVSHGGLDVPLRALAAAAASVWVMVTMTDQRAMWRALGAPKKETRASEQAPKAEA